jgi:hypothetical protein
MHMNANEKAVAVSIFKDLRSRERNIRESAQSGRFGPTAATEDLARANGLATALQYIAEHLYGEFNFDVERAAGK